MSDANDLIGKLERLHKSGDRGSLAALRRGMGRPPGAVPEVCRIVEGMLTDQDPPWLRDTLYIIAPLFAHHPDADADGKGNMGKHFRAMVREGETPPPNIERRFMVLLASEPDDLADALRQAVSLLKSQGVPVNWRQLFKDVQDWLGKEQAGEQARRRVRLTWSRSFWRSRDKTENANAEPGQSSD